MLLQTLSGESARDARGARAEGDGVTRVQLRLDADTEAVHIRARASVRRAVCAPPPIHVIDLSFPYSAISNRPIPALYQWCVRTIRQSSRRRGCGAARPRQEMPNFRGSFAKNINQERPYGRVWLAPDGGEQVLDVQLPTVAVLLKPRVPVEGSRKVRSGETTGRYIDEV
jgi:hypothetical protein